MTGRFKVIYADPPWRYDNATIRGGAAHHYRTMSVAQISALPVARLAADDCALFMWATWPNLPAALEVIAAWGFTYKTCAFAWVKTTSAPKLTAATGLGKYTRGNTEPCLLARRGAYWRADAGVPQVILDPDEETILAPRARHSAKPPEVRDRIVRLMGDVPRIELFARERVAGWEAWGDQLP